jgi:hypothetical protein
MSYLFGPTLPVAYGPAYSSGPVMYGRPGFVSTPAYGPFISTGYNRVLW